MSSNLLLDSKSVGVILHRLANQLLETHLDFTNTVLIGLQPRGVNFAERLAKLLKDDYAVKDLRLGYLDITFFRDDFRRSEKPLSASKTKIDFLVENQKVVFIDDVLYTGRSIQSALSALQSFGRPSSVELMVLIDRRFSRHLPIQPNYRGRQVDAINEERVRVLWKEKDGEDAVSIENKNLK
jgi:pyrimidine operon attenuation protein/uracil phosphoribosyltransferase